MTEQRRIELVWAQDRNRAIGKGNTIPWRVPEDMRHFREVTGDSPVIMGRRTWDSLPVRFRPLPGRHNIVVSRDAALTLDGADVVGSVEAALDHDAPRLAVIGGGQIYTAALPFATAVRLTEIDIAVDAPDAFAPVIDPAEWPVTEAGEWLTSRAGPRYRFVDHRRAR
ncbi:dihydrofolate reductase [Gordonia soli]|uniref:Dihydrofolate reductase n=1 Tax=Gordonia soli NBRC 108243 TaxID=1223545 RepID=M0QS54_9ACTN|nr:dihydrofolate reductase [Gordonia soli]GAC70852.1 dihydrofolate reductase [Gordonia soli NBRC 108243]